MIHTATGEPTDGRNGSAPAPPLIAIIVLNYNTPEMTDALAVYLERDLNYPRKKLYVIDNGSERPPASATHRLPENLGFTRGMHEGYLIASREDDYDAYWLLNSDVGFEYGADVLLRLAEVLFSSERFAQIAPQHNSPHRFMERATSEAQPVPYLEPTATLVKSSTINRVGFWDLELTLGWGVDYDYGYRVRQAGLLNVLTSRARVTHKEHRSITDFDDYRERASAEMNRVLAAKYGADWGRIMSDESRVVPLVLTCDRDAELTARFVESFREVRAGVARPVVVIDTSGGDKLSARYLSLVAALDPRAVFVHPREPGESFYDSVQEAAGFALAKALEETREGDLILFLEDDIRFSPKFLERLRRAELAPDAGLLTLYLPGGGYGSSVIDPEKFYGTQCVLFPRARVEEIVANWADIKRRIPPGYDIRWSRFLAERGYRLYAAEASYVQHLESVSRLHGHPNHVSQSYVG
jgi:GT2 family glycosyltransferase